MSQLRESDLALLMARLEHLEVQSTFQDDLLDALNKTVYRQQQEIDRLRLLIDRLQTQLETIEKPAATTQEIPPHY